MAKHRRKSDEDETSYWLSYSDMMAALLLVFVLIISFTMLQAKRQYEAKEAELAEQQSKADKQQELLVQQQEKLDKIIGVRSDIIAALVKEFENSDLSIDIDEATGAITFPSDLLFDPYQSTLKESSISFLNEFLPRYFSVLLQDDFYPNIAEIVIEGHTDIGYTYMDALVLSQERAFSVAEYALNDESVISEVTDIEKLRKIITVNGRAFTDLVYFEDGTIDSVSTRRVEIKIRLRDEEMVREMLDIINDEE